MAEGLYAQQLAYNIVTDDNISIRVIGGAEIDFGTHASNDGTVTIGDLSPEALTLRVSCQKNRNIKITINDPILQGPGGDVIQFRSKGHLKSLSSSNRTYFNGNTLVTYIHNNQHLSHGNIATFEINIGGQLDIGNVGPGDYIGNSGTITVQYN